MGFNSVSFGFLGGGGSGGGGGSVPLNGITAATGPNSIDNGSAGSNYQIWNWGIFTGDNSAFVIRSTSNILGGGVFSEAGLFSVYLSGDTVKPNTISCAAEFTNQSGDSAGGSTNIAARFTATGAANNYAIQLVDGTQAAGRVLTSDINGYASWQDPAPPYLPSTQIAFGDGSNLMTSSADFTLDIGARVFTVSGFGGSWSAGGTGSSIAISANGDSKFEANNATGLLRIGDVDNNNNGDKLVVDQASSLAYYDNTAHTGKFGVNMSTPAYPLDVNGFINGLGGIGITAQGNNYIKGLNFTRLGDVDYATNIEIAGSDQTNTITYNAPNCHIFNDGANTNTTKVGINIPTPSVALDVYGDINTKNSNSGVFTDGSISQIGDWNNNNSGITVTVNDIDNSAYIDQPAHSLYFGINTSTPSVALDVVGSTTLSVGTGVFSVTTNAGSTDLTMTDATEAVLLRAGGGNITLDCTGGNTILTSSTVQFSNYGAGALTTDGSGNITAVSDERLKTNIAPYKTGLAEILCLNPISYQYNDISKLDTTTVMAGFSAQNVKEFIPYATGENKDGYLTLNDRPILAAAVTAIQELSAQIDDLKKQNKQLLDKIETGNKI